MKIFYAMVTKRKANMIQLCFSAEADDFERRKTFSSSHSVWVNRALERHLLSSDATWWTEQDV